MSPDDADAADTIGAKRYLRGKRYKAQRGKIFGHLDRTVRYMRDEKFGDEWNGYAIGGFAAALVSADPKARGQLKRAKVEAIGEPDTRKELYRLIGLLIAQDYLKERKEEIPAEKRLGLPRRLRNHLDSMLESMAAAGQELGQDDHYASELAVSFPDDDPFEVALALIERAVENYSSLLPEAEDDTEVPDPVERKAIAKAALMRLHVDALEEEAAGEGFSDLPSKDAMATAIAEKYVDDLGKIAEVVLRRERGDPEYGLITRIVPLRDAPALDSAEAAFTSLRGRYIQARTASFFIFGEVERGSNILVVKGKVRSFTVNPAEAGGETLINAKPFTDQIVIRLREDSPWVEINARRSGDLTTVRSVLRRTGEVIPAAAVPVPEGLAGEPYKAWDPRTLWMLDFLRRDLRSDNLALDNTLMAHFLSPETAKAEDEEDEPERNRRPSLAAVRLLGSQLQDHPEACQRIASGSRLHSLEVRVRHVYNPAQGLSKLVRFRLGWEDDHIAVLSGASDDTIDAELHRTLVRLVRQAAPVSSTRKRSSSPCGRSSGGPKRGTWGGRSRRPR